MYSVTAEVDLLLNHRWHCQSKCHSIKGVEMRVQDHAGDGIPLETSGSAESDELPYEVHP